MKKLILLMLPALMSVTSFSQTQIQVRKDANNQTGYLEYKGCTQNCPLIIFLHGAGERGNGTTELERVDNAGLPKFLSSGMVQPFIVLSPQHSPNAKLAYSWNGEIIPFIKHALKKYPQIDSTRIFLTGLSMGDGWVVISESVKGDIRALVTVSGAGQYKDGQRAATINLPVWWWWGDQDATNTYSKSMQPITGMNSINNNHTTPLLSTVIGGGHNGFTWDYVYSRPDIYNWMLSFPSLLPTPPTKLPLIDLSVKFDPNDSTVKYFDSNGKQY